MQSPMPPREAAPSAMATYSEPSFFSKLVRREEGQKGKAKASKGKKSRAA